MHTLLNTRLTRAALKAARPARRHLVRALRHHAARTRALAEHVSEAKPVDGMRAWFHAFFSVLRVRSRARHLSLRTLLYRPTTPLRQLTSRASSSGGGLPASRRPRRLGATSAGWFGFAVR